MSVDICIDEKKVQQLCAKVGPANGGGFLSVKADYGKVTSHISKSAGDMFEAVKEQVGEEEKIVQAMADVCIRLVKSIDTAAKSFRNLDEAMGRKIELKEK